MSTPAPASRVRARRGSARLLRPQAEPLAPGDALAARIEAGVLAPLERALPAAAPVIRGIRKCGGCTHARHALGSEEKHPDYDAPVI